ncbi:MAG: amylo-alpha-1,6-glucosidase [Blastocatellia bacterium]|nr:amylo-alpha-1,6-glucosidase [Blastocatellia bacterium]
MPKRHQAAHSMTHRRHRLSQREKHERKQRVLTHGAPSVTGSIADAVVAKNGSLFFLTDPDGIVPLGGDHGFGMYYNDCRYLSGYDLKLAGAHPVCLVSTAEQGYLAAFQLTNPDIRMSGGALIRKEGIGVRWERLVNAGKLALDELITLENYEAQDVAFPIMLTFEAGFEDIFAIRGLLPEKLGRSHEPEWKDGALSFFYEGADGLYRSLSVNFSPAPDSTKGAAARFDIRLRPGERKQLAISLVIAESEKAQEASPGQHYHSDFPRVEDELRRERDEWVADGTEVRSDSLLLGAVIGRSLRDLYALKSRLGEQEYFAAGVPWFATLFGRDSIITALQTLAYDPKIAAQTLRLLAKYQSCRLDEWRDAQPGKILHELRTGEMAKLGEIPHTPYYGTIDATPLFLILVGRQAAWAGDLKLFDELRDSIEMALEWIDKYGDLNGDGFIEYASASEKGLINQGWKDSGDAIVNADGSLGRPPIALVEAQGYVYRAKREIAELFRRAGADGRAEQLESEADELRRRFNRDFWLKDKGIYALALQAGQEPVTVVSSNPGHALWSGIVDEEKAQRAMERLMADDMFNGWGVRTLSEKERRYNPVGYHLGAVWPHDNSIIAAGFKRYGFDEAEMRIFTGIVQAAMHFAHYRLPELFAGFHRREFGLPVRYPVACHPQAWAAGSVPYLVETSLGLVPEAFEQRLRVVRPQLPDFVHWLEVRKLKVGGAHADLRFERVADGTIAFRVMRIDGRLDVVGDGLVL